LRIDYHITPLFKQHHSSILFQQLRDVKLPWFQDEMNPLPYMEQLDGLDISFTMIPTYSLDIALPCVCAMQQLKFYGSTFFWSIGRTFKALKQCVIQYPEDEHEDLSRPKGLQVDMPFCTKLKWFSQEPDFFTFLSCPNIQTLELKVARDLIPDEAFFKSLLNCSGLQELEITMWWRGTGLSPLFQLIFCYALQQGAWQEIRNVKVTIDLEDPPGDQFLN
jgi:hypothetical protein